MKKKKPSKTSSEKARLLDYLDHLERRVREDMATNVLVHEVLWYRENSPVHPGGMAVATLGDDAAPGRTIKERQEMLAHFRQALERAIAL